MSHNGTGKTWMSEFDDWYLKRFDRAKSCTREVPVLMILGML
jgi:hypothetical protein